MVPVSVAKLLPRTTFCCSSNASPGVRPRVIKKSPPILLPGAGVVWLTVTFELILTIPSACAEPQTSAHAATNTSILKRSPPNNSDEFFNWHLSSDSLLTPRGRSGQRGDATTQIYALNIRSQEKK